MQNAELQIEYLSVDALTPYENNAKNHGEEDVAAIAASIRQFGFSDPIGIWGARNIIVEGHGRLLAAKECGLETVPCIRLDHLTEDERRAYALAHNKTTELSGWDFSTLEAELDALAEEFDMAAFGFEGSGVDEEDVLPGYPESNPDDLRPYRPEPQEGRGEPPVTTYIGNQNGNPTESASEDCPVVSRETNFHYREQYAVTVMCRDEADQKEIYERLTAEGYDCRVVCV